MAAHFGFYGKWKESVESLFRCEGPVSPKLSRLGKTSRELLRKNTKPISGPQEEAGRTDNVNCSRK